MEGNYISWHEAEILSLRNSNVTLVNKIHYLSINLPKISKATKFVVYA